MDRLKVTAWIDRIQFTKEGIMRLYSYTSHKQGPKLPSVHAKSERLLALESK